MKTPLIPSNAPYSETQKAWLAGFFAGMHSHMMQNAGSVSTEGQKIVHILFGSQTGNAESVAHDAAQAAKAHGLAPKVLGMDEIDLAAFCGIENLLIVTSTYGEGEMPDNAEMLWQQVKADDAPKLSAMNYAVLSLGDTSYDQFCQAGIDWDNRLAELGANRVFERVDCDVDFEEPAANWIAETIPLVNGGAGHAPATVMVNHAPAPEKAKYNRKNPYPARLAVNRLLTADNSSKETRHYEITIEGSGLSYEAGDALAVIPSNGPELVKAMLDALGCRGDEDVTLGGELIPLCDALQNRLEIRTPSKELLNEIARRGGDQTLNAVLTQGDAKQLADYLWGKDSLDFLIAFPDMEFSAAEFVALLKPLQHRAYSISSSGKVHPDRVHLTVASVRYQGHGRHYKGVCSTFLADLADENTVIPCFFMPNKTFRVPEDNNVPMIMVGPGTGLAPFRAFLQERQYRGAAGKNWLFFGDRNAATDFIYREEIEAFQQSGLLTRLDLAFSRDQAEKIYVQDRMREHAAELYAWLEQGGYFFVCGDAYHMAKDVDKALHEIIATEGGMTFEQAAEYVNNLKKDKRYVRDVY
ncbi:MAG: sulfite reductase flavoprotein subunit alpha [Methylococcales bacterium]|nr:sulfite reductase flavoprotein subunit alpha [Methylococcales bacterium]